MDSKMIKYMKIFMITLIGVLFCGCSSGLYKISLSEGGKTLDQRMCYKIVPSLSDEEFDPHIMSVEVSSAKDYSNKTYYYNGKLTNDSSELGISGWLCLLSLGVFPRFLTEHVDGNVIVNTPLGAKSGTWRVDAKTWYGWIPLFVAYPDFADKRVSTPVLPDPEIEALAQKTLVDSLVKQFSYDEYIKFASQKNKDRDIELSHIAAVKKSIGDLCAKHQYDEAEALLSKESVSRSGTFVRDTAMWTEVKASIAEKKELHRATIKEIELKKLLEEEKFEEVVRLCNEELKISDDEGNPLSASIREKVRSMWVDLRDGAKKSIWTKARAAELKRIELRKEEIEKLLDRKDYAAVIVECDKEKGTSPAAKYEDAEIWASFRRRALQEKAKSDRDVELRRIADKVNQIEKLMQDKDYDSVIKACEEEKGMNAGSRPEDMPQWKAYRSKALGLRLLQNVDARDKSTFNIKGFHLGMSLEEAEILLRYYFPTIAFRKEYNQIMLVNHPMVFCQAEYGKVTRINFTRRMLEKLFEYDVQTTKEWSRAFAKEYSIDFHAYKIQDKKIRGDAVVAVSQECYKFKDRKRGAIVTVFDEQKVVDFNADPNDLTDQADQEAALAVFGGFLGGSNSSGGSTRRILRYERMRNDIVYVRNWLRTSFVNEKGAEDGTLRLEMLGY